MLRARLVGRQLRSKRAIYRSNENSEPEAMSSDGPGPSCVYHYTSVEALLGILDTKCLFASDLESLNDPAELTHARQLLEEICTTQGISQFLPRFPQLRELLEEDPIPDELIPSQDDYSRFTLNLYEALKKRTQSDWKVSVGRVFGVSFCSQGDLLSQWRGYGLNGGGVCIGFNATLLAECFGTTVQLVKVEYDRARQRDQIQSCLTAAFRTYIEKIEKLPQTNTFLYPTPNDVLIHELLNSVLAEISQMAHLFKRPGFSEEQEHRLVCRIPVDSTSLDAVRLRAKTNQLVPYLPLTPVSGPLPVEHIIQGPAYTSQNADYALRASLRRLGRPGAEIKVSKYSLR